MEEKDSLPERFKRSREYRERTEEDILRIEEQLCKRVGGDSERKLRIRLGLYRGAYQRICAEVSNGRYHLLKIFNRIDDGSQIFAGIPHAQPLLEELRYIQYEYYTVYFALLEEAIYTLKEESSKQKRIIPGNLEITPVTHTDFEPEVNEVLQLSQDTDETLDPCELLSSCNQLENLVNSLMADRRAAIDNLEMQRALAESALYLTAEHRQTHPTPSESIVLKTDMPFFKHRDANLEITEVNSEFYAEKSPNLKLSDLIPEFSDKTALSALIGLKMATELAERLKQRILDLQNEESVIQNEMHQSQCRLAKAMSEL